MDSNAHRASKLYFLYLTGLRWPRWWARPFAADQRRRAACGRAGRVERRRSERGSMSAVAEAAARLGARPQAQPGRAPEAGEGAARDPRRAAGADRAGLRERRRGGHRPPAVVGPLPRQAEDRDVHAAHQGAGRASCTPPSCARSARSRTSTAAATASSRRGRTSSSTGSSSRSCPTSSPTSSAPASRPPAAAATPCATSPAARVQGIAADELFDATPIVDAAADLFYGNPDWAEPAAQAQVLDLRLRRPLQRARDQLHLADRHDHDDGREGFARARRRRPLVGAADRARHGRLHPEGGGERDPRRDHDASGRRTSSTASRASRRGSSSWSTTSAPEGIRERVEARLGRKLEDYTLPPIDVEPSHHLGVHAAEAGGPLATSASRSTSA